MIKYEALITFKEMIKYKIGFISEFLIFALTFMLLLFFNDSSFQGVPDSQGKILLLIGYIFWNIGVVALGFSSSHIISDAKSGLLELKMQSFFSIVVLNLIKVFISIISTLCIIIIILFFTVISTNIGYKDISELLPILIFVIPSVFGMFGIGLIFGGGAILEKNIGSMLMIFQGALLFLGNTTRPIVYNMEKIVPFSLGIEITRAIYLNKSIHLSDIILYIVINAAWFFIGWIIFSKILKWEKRSGMFDTY